MRGFLGSRGLVAELQSFEGRLQVIQARPRMLNSPPQSHLNPACSTQATALPAVELHT